MATPALSSREIDKYTPAYQPLSLKVASKVELELNDSLITYVQSAIQTESEEETQHRKDVLLEIRAIFLKFVRTIAIREAKYSEDELEENLVADLFVSGSHRLGVKDIGADIDTVCVAPHFVKREHFFRDLKADLLANADVTNMNAVEEAFVPVMEFEFQGVAIDLLFARLGDTNKHPLIDGKFLNLMDDSVLLGVDSATMTSLNGPRVTNMIIELVKNSYDQFLVVLRCVRRWAKKRGLYGNKMGYLGGVNCNILVAFICQLYPNACPSMLLAFFFRRYMEWKFPEPIQLNNIQRLGIAQWDDEVWSSAKSPHDIMPLITPAYPAMNSTYNVNVNSFAVLKDEFKRGYEVMTEILKEKRWKQPESWGKLFDPSDFFLKYSHYLACHILGNESNAQSRSWIGFVESRLRRLTIHPFLERLPLLTPIHLHPVVSHTERSANSVCYFIGFHVDYETMAELGVKELHIDQIVAQFTDGLWDPERGHNKGQRIDGLDFYVEHLTWKKLPKVVFEAYGGYEAAKKTRKEMGFDQRRTRPATDSKGAMKTPMKSPAPVSATAAVPATPAAPQLNPLELAKQELLKADPNDFTRPAAVAAPTSSSSSFSKVSQIREKMLRAIRPEGALESESSAEQVVCKKPRHHVEEIRPPANYHLPNVTWQLLDSR